MGITKEVVWVLREGEVYSVGVEKVGECVRKEGER